MNVNKDELWHQRLFHINKKRLHQFKYMSIGLHNIYKSDSKNL